MELDDVIYEQVTTLSGEGDALAEAGDFAEAAEKFRSALALLPTPVTQWEAGGWLYTALGDVHYLSGLYEQAGNDLFDALNCPGTQDNPFVHLKLGQSLLEAGKNGKAAEHLLKAYMLGGEEIFDGEDPVYFNTIKTMI